MILTRKVARVSAISAIFGVTTLSAGWVGRGSCDMFDPETRCPLGEGATGVDPVAESGGGSVEGLMRQAQARYVAVKRSYFKWPACPCDGGDAPAFPPTGFYGEYAKDPAVELALLYAVHACLQSCFGDYISPETANGISGEATVPQDLDWTFSEVCDCQGPYTVENVEELSNALKRVVGKLQYVLVGGVYSTTQGKTAGGPGLPSCGACPGCYQCGMQGLTQAISAWSAAAKQGEPLYCHPIDPGATPCWEGGFGAWDVTPWSESVDGPASMIGVYHAGAFQYDGDKWYGIGVPGIGGPQGLGWAARRGRLKADLRGQPGSGTLYINVGWVDDEKKAEGCPSSNNGKFIGAGSVQGDGVWESPQTYGDISGRVDVSSGDIQGEEIPGAVCIGAYNWGISDAVIVFQPRFDSAPSGEGKCGERKDCADCDKDAGGRVDSVNWGFSLGTDRYGKQLGRIQLFTKSILGDYAGTPWALFVRNPGYSGSEPRRLDIRNASPASGESGLPGRFFQRQFVSDRSLVNVENVRWVTNPYTNNGVNEYGYDLSVYEESGFNRGSFVNGLIEVTGEPNETYQVRQYVGTVPHPVTGLSTAGARLRIFRSTGGTPRFWEWVQVGDSWAYSEGLGSGFTNVLRREILEVVADGLGGRSETRTIQNGPADFANYGPVAGKVRSVFTALDGPTGPVVLTSKTIDPDGAALTTNYVYDTLNSSVTFGKLTSVLAWDGRWEQFEYDTQGRRAIERRSYLGSTLGSQQNEETRYGRFFADINNDGVTESIIERTELVQQLPIRRVLTVYWGRVVTLGNTSRQQVSTVVLADATIPSSQYSSVVAAAVSDPVSSPHSISHTARTDGPESGTATDLDMSFSPTGYVSATIRELIGSNNEALWQTTTYSGQLLSQTNLLTQTNFYFDPSQRLAPGYSKSVNRRNRYGYVVFSQQRQHDGTTERIVSTRAATNFETTGLKRRVTKYESFEGPAQHEEIEYSCCNVSARRDADGIRSEFEYDGLGRMIVERREIAAGEYISMHYAYDARDRVRSVIRRDTSGSTASQIIESSTTFDPVGRVSSMYRAGSGTSTQVEIVANGRVVRTTTLQDPDAGGPEVAPVIIETMYPGGRLESVTGSGTNPVRYEYGVISDTDPQSSLGSFAAPWTKTIRVGDGNASTEWSTEYSNRFGNTYKRVAADGATSRQFFDATGRMIRSVDPDGVATLYRERFDRGDSNFNASVQFALESAAADWSLTAIDINQNEEIDFTSGATGPSGTLADRIQLTQRYLQSDQDGVWRVRTSKAWTDPSSATSVVASSTSRDRIDGLRRESLAYDRKTIATLTRNRATASTQTEVVSPDGTSSAVLSSYGLERSMATFSTVLNAAPLTQVNYFYDAFGRKEQVTDTRGTSAVTDDRISFVTFNSVGLPVTSTTPAPAANEPTQTTTKVYDALGRVIRVDLPDGVSQHTAYFPNGKVRKTYGARMYPSEYTYDSQGRMKTLKTWKDFNESTGIGNTGAAVTTWNYSPTRGFLSSKTYEDNQAGPTYTYKPSGRLLTRTWARGITTTYGYNNAGELASINYSDTTPDVSMQFDRLGRTTQIIDGIGTRTLGYATDNSLLLEDFSAGSFDEISQHSGYDPLGRRTSFEVKKNTVGVSSVAFGYDAQTGRYSSVTKGGVRADYGYEPGGELLNSLTFRNGTASNSPAMLTTSYNIDAIGRMRSIAHDSVAGSDESYTYAYDAANQRTRMDLIDGSSWVYQYDAMGQVASGKRYKNGGATPANPLPGQQYEYAFDDIGNRTSAKMGGDASGGGLRTTTYTSNGLNQYTERNNNRSSDIMGYAAAANSVLVEGQPADYRWNRFYQKLISRPSGGSLLHFIEIESDPTSFGPDDFRAVIVPPSLEKYIYDLDGNMTQDARWKYFWDGENRLISMETRPNLDSSIPRRKLEFNYDYASRRVKRESFGWIDLDINPDPGDGGVIIEDEGAGSSGGGGGGAPDPASIPDGFWELDSTWHYLWDGWNLAMELTGDITPWRSYGWGLDLSQSEQGAGGVGGLLFSTEHSQSTTQLTRFTTYDGNGNVTSYRAAAGDSVHAPGVLIAAYEYGPFGETVATDGRFAASQSFRFSTKFQDGETGLLYYGYRYYNAGTGRWLNRDRISELGGIGLYVANSNDSVCSIDLFGLEPVDFESPELKKARICEALQEAIRQKKSIEEFVREWDPTWGTRSDDTPFYQSKGQFIGEQVDIDWLLTLVHARYGPDGIKNLPFKLLTQNRDPSSIYPIGKTFWIILDSARDEDRHITDFFKRFGQRDELMAVAIAQEIADDKISRDEFYYILAEALDCKKASDDACREMLKRGGAPNRSRTRRTPF